MPIYAILASRLVRVQLLQTRSLGPYLRVHLNLTLESNGNNNGVTEMTLLGAKCMLLVRDGPELQEIGLAEALSDNNVFPGVGATHELRFDLRVSHFELQKLEEIRSGGDLHFLCHSLMWIPASYTRDGERATENVHINTVQDRNVYKYPRSEWIDDLNKTDYGKIDMIEIPQLQIANVAASKDVQRFLSEAQKAIMEGRYGDALGECRKVLNVVYNAVDAWGASHEFEKEIAQRLQDIKAGDRPNALRKYVFEKLVGHKEKGERINNLRNVLFQYLSLDAHEADHSGMEFTPHDALLAVRVTTGFAANVLRYLANAETKYS